MNIPGTSFRVRSASAPTASAGHRSLLSRAPRCRSIPTPVVLLMLMVGAWSALVFLVNPVGDFPLNDDWSYSRSVETLIDHGRLQFTAFNSMTLIAQVGWGALFCLPFGFSFLSLRLSTLVLGALGIVAAYLLLREVRVNRQTALLGASLVAINPLYFSLSFTFMTDVPFVAVSMLSLLFFVRSFRTDSSRDIIVGYAFATLAILIRQNAAILPVAFAISYVLMHGLRRRAIAYGLLPLGAELVLVAAYPVVIAHTIGLPFYYISARGVYGEVAHGLARDWLHVLGVTGDRLLVETLYLGLFLLPLTIVMGWLPRAISDWRRPRRLWAGSALAVAVGVLVLGRGRVMPLSGNVFYDLGLGPPLLRDTYVLGLHHLPGAPRGFWLAVTVAAVIGTVPLVRSVLAVGLRAAAATTSGSGKLEPAMLCVWIVGVGYLVNTAITTSTPRYASFDRYFIFALVPLMMVLAHGRSNPPGKEDWPAFGAAILLTLAFGAFSVGATHDYLAWNRARWNAGRDLLRQGVSSKHINGGFEFNGWYGYNPSRPLESLESLWTHGDEYLISFGPVNGYSEVRRYPYRRWMPWGQGRVVVLRRHAQQERGVAG